MATPVLSGIAIFCVIDGLFLSIWAIVYMHRVGDGNPMDAFGHKTAPRTKHLMTDGPYRLSHNPMLTGIFVYLLCCCLWLGTWQSVVVFLAFVAIMLAQVRTEEECLHRDFGRSTRSIAKKWDGFCRLRLCDYCWFHSTCRMNKKNSIFASFPERIK